MSKEKVPVNDGEQLFDQLPEDSILTEKEAKLNYDGTVLNGRNVVRVNFDDKGGVMEINSYSVQNLREEGKFVRGVNGWEWKTNFFSDFSETGKRLNEISKSTTGEWKIWKITEPQHLGMDFQKWKAERREVVEQLKKY